MKKWICSLILAAAVMLTLGIAVSAETSGDYSYTVNEDGVTAKITWYTGTEENIVIPETLDGYQITSIGNSAFYQSAAKSITLPKGLVSLEKNAFSNLKELKSITFQEGLTSIGEWAFSNCTNLVDVYCPSILDWCKIEFAHSYSTPMYYAENLYVNGQLLTGDLIIPEGITTLSDYAFYNCVGIKSVTFPQGITSVGDMAFTYCTNLTDVYSPSLYDWCKIDFKDSPLFYARNLYFNNQLLEGEVVIPEGISSIGRAAFVQYEKITSVVFPKELTSIGEWTFHGCTGLTSIIFPEGLVSIGMEAFSSCDNLINITFSESLTSIGDYAFAFCTNLPNISLPKKLTQLGEWAFHGCSSLQCVEIPEKITSISKWAFASCTNLETVVLPNTLTSIGNGAFAWCTYLSEITFPEGLVSIGNQAFEGSSLPYEIIFPQSLTSIGDRAFASCNIDSITFSKGFVSIGNEAFYGCGNLGEAKFYGDVPKWGTNVFGRNWNSAAFLDEFVIYYPEGNTSGWSSPTWEAPDGTVYKTATFVPETPPCITLVTGTEEYGDIQIPIEDFTYSNLVKNFGQIFNLFKEGYSFGGWHTDSSQSSKISFELDTDAIRQAAQKAQEVSKTISLYVNWVENSKITLEKDDVFDFTNSADYFCVDGYDSLSEAAKKAYKYDIYTQDIDKLLTFGNRIAVWAASREKWSGSCFGMSSVVALAAKNILLPSDFDRKTVSEMQIPLDPDPNLTQTESLVNYYYLSQFYGKIEKIRNNYSSLRSKNVVKILEKMKNSNAPVVLGFDLIDTKKNRLGGHAVVAYDLTYNEETKLYTVQIYDCSLTMSSRYQTFQIEFTEDGLATDTEYEGIWKLSYPTLDFLFYKYAITADELVQHIPAYLDKPITAASAAIPAAFTLSTDVPRYTLETNYNSFRIESGDLYADVNNSTITGTLDIQFSDVLNEIGAPIELAYSLPVLEDGAVYSVTPSADNNLDEYRTTFMYDDAADGFYLRADADACGTITLGTDTLLSTSFPETAEQELTVALNAWNAPWQSLVMNGSSTGYQVVSAEDGAQFTSDTPTTVSVSAEVFLDSVRFEEIELTSAGITVTESEDRVCSILSGEETVSTRNIGHYVIFDSRLGSNVDTVYDIPDDGLCEEPTEPTREGYLFTGWYTDLLFGNKWDFAADTVTDNMILYAGWTRDPDYYCTVVFHFEDHAELLFVKRGESLSEEALPDIPHKDGVIQKWDIDDLSAITEDMDIYIKTSTIGDINGDTEVTPEDYNILIDYFSGKSADVTIPSATADFNGDNLVTRADAMILARYLAKWPGYAEKYFQ